MKPTIYCHIEDENLRAKILEDNRSLKFWNIVFDKNCDYDIALFFYEKSILIEGLSQGCRMTTDLGAILNLLSPMDLSYIYDLFDTEEEQKDMLTLAKQELEINLEELIRAVASQEPKQIKHFAHKLTSKILVLSIPALEACQYIEQQVSNFESAAFQEKYHLLKMYCLIRLGQIQE